MTPDQQPDPIALALAVAAILERLGIPYLVGGSLASSIHGELRSTNDVDFVADVRPGHVAPLLAALGGEFYVSEEAVREAAARWEQSGSDGKNPLWRNEDGSIAEW